MSLNWLFLDLNSYFASVEQAENPHLQGKPIAVVPMLADTTSCLAASYPAKAKGVKTGTSLRDARRLCPDIIFIPANHKKYVSYHHKILEVVDTCLPITQVLSIDEMSCELIGREREEVNARKIAQNIKKAIYERISPALTCSIGIAPNSYLAKVASDMQKPDGLTVVHKEQIPEIFFSLKPRDFPGIGAKMELRLANARCLTVKKMYQLSIHDMREIWGGITGERFWWLIRGETLDAQATERRTIGHSRVLAPQHRNYQDAWSISVQLLSKAAMRLREEGFNCKELTFSMKFMTNNLNEKYWKARAKFIETKNTSFLIKELEKLWKELLKSKSRNKILKVSVTLHNLVSEQKKQLSLFEDYKSNSLMKALDTVNKKYKSSTVYIAGAQNKDEIGKAPTTKAPIAFQHIPKAYE